LININEKDNKPSNFWAISQVWTEDHLKTNDPEIVSEYPEYSLINGTQQTIFHYKNGGYVYGRPDTIQASLNKYSEFQNLDYRIKNTDNKFTGELIMEAEGRDPNGPELTPQKYDQNFTNKGEDPLSLMYSERPYGSRPLFVYQVKPNTNSTYYVEIGNYDALQIIKSHGLTEKLMGESKGTGIAGSDFLKELATRLPLIRNHQNKILFNINKAITEIMNFMEPSLVGNGIDFSSKLLDMAEASLSEIKQETNVTEQQ
jgi:hypothetical protein